MPTHPRSAPSSPPRSVPRNAPESPPHPTPGTTAENSMAAAGGSPETLRRWMTQGPHWGMHRRTESAAGRQAKCPWSPAGPPRWPQALASVSIEPATHTGRGVAKPGPRSRACPAEPPRNTGPSPSAQKTKRDSPPRTLFVRQVAQDFRRHGLHLPAFAPTRGPLESPPIHTTLSPVDTSLSAGAPSPESDALIPFHTLSNPEPHPIDPKSLKRHFPSHSQRN